MNKTPPQSDLRPRLAQAAKVMALRFGHDRFLPGQEASLQSILSPKSLLVVMPTGSGKSLLYQLPALLDQGLTVVVSPLIALMKDQVDDLLSRGIPATFVNSSLSLEEQRLRLNRCAAGEFKLLYIAPERFRNQGFLSALARIKVARMAVDEAHCISEWGHDFRPDYLRLKKFRQMMGKPLVTALTATATARVQHDIVEALGLTQEDVDVHVHGFDRKNLALRVHEAGSDADKNKFLLEFVRTHEGSGIVYAGTRKLTEKVGELLRSSGTGASVYHAGMDAPEREAAQDRFISGKDRVIAATTAFGMGIDKPDIRFVIHYNYPGSVEQYYQEIGRAGRDGKVSECVLLYSAADRFLREFFIDLNYPGPDLVEDVYRTLWRIPENPVKLTYAQVAELCREKVKDGQVGASVRLLDAASLTKAFSGEPRVAITLGRPGAELLASVRGPAQRSVLEALSSFADIEVPGRYEVSLDELCRVAGLNEDQARRALMSLDHAGLAVYEPPFRGRGIEKLTNEPPPFAEVPIDWERQDLLRGIEEDKLAAMEEYIAGMDCRRGYILRYFGEKDSFRCGMCDRCQVPDDKGAKGSVVEREPEIALPILVCARHLRFGVGKGRIAQVVTGARDKKLLAWGLDRNPAYAAVKSDQQTVKKIIDELTRQGFLKREGDAQRPTLTLTERGREAALSADLAAMLRAGPRQVQAPLKVSKPKPGAIARYKAAADAEIQAGVLRCLNELPFPVGAGKVGEVLTGSRAKWIKNSRVDALAVYGAVDAGRERIREVISAMLAKRLIRKAGEELRPVLELAPAGLAMLESMAGDAEEAKTAQPAPRLEEPEAEDEETRPEPDYESRAEMSSPKEDRDYYEEEFMEERKAPDQSAAARLDSLLARLLSEEADKARRMLPELSIFHPRAIALRLSHLFDEAEEQRERARAVWAAGELGGPYALILLSRAAASEDENIRRLAASALMKIFGAMKGQEELAADLVEAREALLKLREDPSVQVRQSAEKALQLLPAPGKGEKG